MDWRKRFEEIGFGNQCIIVGTKRVELVDFIQQLLDQRDEEIIEKLEEIQESEGYYHSANKTGCMRSVDQVLDRAISTIKENK